MTQDYTDRGFGIRVADNYCVVIERKPGVNGWVEDGLRHPLPLPLGFESIQAIPTSRVAIAFKAYELAHPGDGLRELLTQESSAVKEEGTCPSEVRTPKRFAVKEP
jgi:hypothetical protein